MKKYLYILLALIIGITSGYYIPREPKVEIKDRVVEKERVVRRIVRVTKPDGTIEEVIDEKEKRDSRRKSTIRVSKENRKWLLRASADPRKPENWEIGVGYWLNKDLALETSYDRFNKSINIGILVKF